MNKVRYLNKTLNSNERENYSKWWREQIEHYGTLVTYYTDKTTINNTHIVYGESPTAGYQSHGQLIIQSSITNDSIILAKFGVQADCDMTAVMHISAYYEIFGPGTEPKAGDLIEMTEYGGFGDRPNQRGAPIYEITERDDEYLQMTNALAGHYVWYLKCRRFEYSYEDNINSEASNNQVSDTGEYGIVGVSSTQNFLPSVDDFASEFLYDYKNTNIDSPYGNY